MILPLSVFTALVMASFDNQVSALGIPYFVDEIHFRITVLVKVSDVNHPGVIDWRLPTT